MSIILLKKLKGILGESQDGMQTVTNEFDCTLSTGHNFIKGSGRKKKKRAYLSDLGKWYF